LGFVAQLLKVAAAAAPEVRTGRLDAQRRGRNNFLDRSEGDVAARALYRHTNAVAGRGQRDKERAPVGVGQAGTARQDALYQDLYLRDVRVSLTTFAHIINSASFNSAACGSYALFHFL
jgi:hypothetical protein